MILFFFFCSLIYYKRAADATSDSKQHQYHRRMSSAENAFRQQFSSWTNRSSTSATTRPVYSEWTDYIKTSANDLYSSLPTYNTAGTPGNPTSSEEPLWFRLSRLERIIGFGCCLAASILCFVLSFFLFPVLALKPRKFGMLWSMGSLLFVLSFGILQGPASYTRHLLSRERFVFTIVFFGSVLLTMYTLVILKSTILTIFSSIIEIFAVLYYTISYFPFGAGALTWFTSYLMGYIGGFIGGIL